MRWRLWFRPKAGSWDPYDVGDPAETIETEFISGPMPDNVRWLAIPGTTADHEPPSLYDWERHGL